MPVASFPGGREVEWLRTSIDRRRPPPADAANPAQPALSHPTRAPCLHGGLRTKDTAVTVVLPAPDLGQWATCVVVCLFTRFFTLWPCTQIRRARAFSVTHRTSTQTDTTAAFCLCTCDEKRLICAHGRQCYTLALGPHISLFSWILS